MIKYKRRKRQLAQHNFERIVANVFGVTLIVISVATFIANIYVNI